MKKNKNKRIKLEIELLDNGFVVTEDGTTFAFEDWDNFIDWLQESSNDN